MKIWRLLIIAALGLAMIGALLWFLIRSTQEHGLPMMGETSLSQQPIEIPSQQTQKCAQCHQNAFQDWLGSQHARANQSLKNNSVDFSTASEKVLKQAGTTTKVRWEQDALLFEVTDPKGITQSYHPEMIIGLDPLIQFLISLGSGRWQAFEWAWDPKAKEWFYVFEGPARGSEEWGHWRGRGMNWNSQCAACHMTGYHKAYDAQKDAYHSTWQGMGISCLQCHGGMEEHPKRLSAVQSEDNCASCHSRREELHSGFAAGDRFNDFYRLMLPDHPDLFYADGQVKGEVFEYNSFQLSKMAHRGVSCLDCHQSHTGQLLRPIENNGLCLSCHQAPGLKGAIPIDPVSHSHHSLDSAGNRCVNCHMPAKTFMVRDHRRDHGFTIPDPLMTQEFHIPNACNTCHRDRSTQWAVQKTQAWYKEKMNRRSRDRTRAIAKAQEGDPEVWRQLLSLAQEEEIPAWRATLIAHLSPWLEQSGVRPFLVASLKDESPLVRSAAVQVLQNLPEAMDYLSGLKEDPTRLVRLDVAWAAAIRGENAPDYPEELLAYLNFHSDQPVGALRLGQLAMVSQNFDKAVAWMQKAIRWDPGSAYPQYLMGRALYALKRLEEARESFEQATRLDPQNSEYTYHLALLLAEMGQGTPSRQWLEKTVELGPEFGRAWFNLGLAYLQEEQVEKALAALERAETLLPHSPDPPQVLAEVYRKRGQRAKSYEKFQKAQKLRSLPPPESP